MAFLVSWRPTASNISSFPLMVKTCPKTAKMGYFSNNISCSAISSVSVSGQRKLPILLFDVMDTIVRDPFYHDIPAFFRMPMKELLECKHPTAWIEFEKGLITEDELAMKFFKDGRSFDLEGLKNCLRSACSYIEGVEGLLNSLKENGYEIHAFTNFPIWYQIIEDKLKLSNYLSWTFRSCVFGKRKPDPEFYLEVVKHLNVEASNCVFIDDRMRNVEAAVEIGLKGLRFKNVDLLRKDLCLLGVDVSTNENSDLADVYHKIIC
ncbi:flavin mononucleotide hydrolase 1, chloroplatic-like [Nicotiana tabacum]|uniref:flavin mononucleotide hydrolase 1, chloroplatic-like n=1 Tax=Nicotiana tabacum TaxID=4097 RepID=UPI003F4EFCE1